MLDPNLGVPICVNLYLFVSIITFYLFHIFRGFVNTQTQSTVNSYSMFVQYDFSCTVAPDTLELDTSKVLLKIIAIVHKNLQYRGVLISGCWNRGVPLYTEVSSFQGVGIEEFHCIQRCPHFRGLE